MVNKLQRIKLEYNLDDLEFFISRGTMHYHYEILHKNYEIRLNEILDKFEKELKNYESLEDLMINIISLPLNLQKDICFFGGGLMNHNFFFLHLMNPIKKEEQDKKLTQNNFALLKEIKKLFGSLNKFFDELADSALKIRGSG
jgi:Fe-Mn family superoxide dismutase